LKSKLTPAEMDLALELATPEQLKKALKKRHVYKGRRIVGSYCPNGCGSIRNSKAMKRHLQAECKLPLRTGDASPNWMTAAFAEKHSEGPHDVGFPPDTYAKCEIILGDGTRHTSVLIRRTEDGLKMWNLGLFGVGLIHPQDVLAWKVQEHYA